MAVTSEDEAGLEVLRERELEDLAARGVQQARRRLRGKQAAQPQPPQAAARPEAGPLPLAAVGEQTVAAEAWSELVGLDPDARRQHVHWTHVRTQSAEDRQPESFTREEFWLLLCRVYKEVYPEPANKTGSILLFGAVAKEHHASCAEGAARAEHHHAPTYCSKRHLWKNVAARAHSVYNVNLHAACHAGYSSMYSYICCPSPKKPLSELDAEVFLSPDHPRGEVLRRLLEAGAKHDRAFGGRRRRASDSAPVEGQEQSTKRFRSGDVYTLVAEQGIRTLGLARPCSLSERPG